MAAAVRHTVKLGTHKRALGEAGDQGLPFTKGPLVFETTGAMGEETQKWRKSIVEMEAEQRIPGAPQSRREQGLEKQVVIVLATHFLNVTCQDASRTLSSVDRDLPEGLSAKTASHCLVLVNVVLSFIIALA